MNHTAVGIHVFAGGFTAGVKNVMPVQYQLETHGFGLETATKMCGVECINSPAVDWPHIDASFAYGNPRCTGFSTITSGYDERIHGPWAAATCDIHEFCNYVADRYDIVIWESVQQAYSVGKPLLDYLRDDIFAPKGYRIAHVFINAASCGNSQLRKRYFFVAYRSNKNFNIVPPTLNQYLTSVWDAIGDLEDRETNEMDSHDYDENSYVRLTPDEKVVAKQLNYGWDVNQFLQYRFKDAPKNYQEKWLNRTSALPFSLHSIRRISYMLPCPTLFSSSNRILHPIHERPLTVLELARLMGWGDNIPVGKFPMAQIAKGVVPAVGEWLAQQAVHYLDNDWGDDDWESSYDHRKGEWVGKSTNGQLEKTFVLNNYIADYKPMEEWHDDLRAPKFLRRVGRVVEEHMFPDVFNS